MRNRELDAEVAREIMGLEVKHRKAEHFTRDDGSEGEAPEVWWVPGSGLPAYSSDIAAAWEIVEKMRERGYPTITVCLSERAEPTVTVWLPEPDKHGNYCRSVWAPTVPLAICMAALRAVRED